MRDRAYFTLAVLSMIGSTALKLVIAARTFGQDDVIIWAQFARAAGRAGPIDVYDAIDLNHPPLSAWLVWLLFQLAGDVSWSFLVRAPMVMADLVTMLIVYLMVRRRRGVPAAAIVVFLIAFSPVLIIQASFHGNWDALVISLAVVSVFLLEDKGRPFASGVAVGLAVSVKIFPVVLLPLLAARAFAKGSKPGLAQFFLGGGMVFAVLWLPVLIRHSDAYVGNVLGYSGDNTPRQWGVVPIVEWMVGSPSELADLVVFPGRFLMLILATSLPLLLNLRGRLDLPASLGLALAILLFTLPAWGPQYLAWPIVFGYFLAPRLITLYQLASGIFSLVLYSHWSGQPPGRWFQAIYDDLIGVEWWLMVASWAAIGAVCIVGVRAGRSTDGIAPSSARIDASRRSTRGPEPIVAANVVNDAS